MSPYYFSPHSWDQTKAPCHSPNISGEVVISCHCFDKSELPFEAGGVFVISHVTSVALRFWVTHFVFLCICLPFILRQDQWNMLGYLKISKSGKTCKNYSLMGSACLSSRKTLLDWSSQTCKKYPLMDERAPSKSVPPSSTGCLPKLSSIEIGLLWQGWRQLS